MRALIVSLFAILGFNGCVVAQIRPAPGGQQVAPVGDVASATASGIRVSVDGTAWNGYPSDLGQFVSPIYVSIENHSGHQIRVQYSDFQIVGGSGFHYTPLAFLNQRTHPNPSSPTGPKPPSPPSNPPPTLHQAPNAPDGNPGTPGTSGLNGERMVPDAVDATWFPEADPLSGRVELAMARGPILARYHPYRAYHWVRPYWGPTFWYPYGYWYSYPYWYGAPYYARWQVELPTRDMLNAGLPEGTIDDGGQVAGFLYFQRLTNRESQLRFEARLPDARSGETVATISIPLIVAR